MSKIVLPKVEHMRVPQGVSFDLMPSALQKWNGALAAKKKKKMAEDEIDTSISVYDPIGADPWTGEGVTAKRIAAALRTMDGADVTVNINSPGGDLFEGIAIYNMLRDHPGEVTTRVVGLAASAASIVAMAGDKIEVAEASFMMIHNVWVMAMGNRNDLRDAADQLETFDDALASIYAARTGQDKKAIAKMMDKETWFSGDQAVEGGFADGLMPTEDIEESAERNGSHATLRNAEMLMARAGMSRSVRRGVINAIKDSVATPGAGREQDRIVRDADPKAVLDAGELVKSFTASLQKG